LACTDCGDFLGNFCSGSSGKNTRMMKGCDRPIACGGSP
jgi:hypothetical protein